MMRAFEDDLISNLYGHLRSTYPCRIQTTMLLCASKVGHDRKKRDLERKVSDWMALIYGPDNARVILNKWKVEKGIPVAEIKDQDLTTGAEEASKKTDENMNEAWQAELQALNDQLKKM